MQGFLRKGIEVLCLSFFNVNNYAMHAFTPEDDLERVINLT